MKLKLQSGETLTEFQIVRESTTHIQILTKEQVQAKMDPKFGEWFSKEFLVYEN